MNSFLSISTWNTFAIMGTHVYVYVILFSILKEKCLNANSKMTRKKKPEVVIETAPNRDRLLFTQVRVTAPAIMLCATQPRGCALKYWPEEKFRTRA